MVYALNIILSMLLVTAWTGQSFAVDACVELAGWRISGNYLFKLFEEKVTHAVAKAECSRFGGNLAAGVLRNLDFARYISDSPDVGGRGRMPWVGLEKVDGVWMWVDGGTTNLNTIAWNSGEPNNHTGNQIFAQIWTAKDGKLFLNDEGGKRRQPYICEIYVGSV